MDEPLRPIGPMQEQHQDLFVADLLCRGTTEWNIPKITSILPQHLSDILRIKPSITGATDSYMWLASKSGTYSAKSGYYAATTTEAEAPVENQRTFKAIWKRKTSPKLQLFIWKVVQGALALGENLAKRGLMANTACRYCGDLETAEHIFLHCYHTRQIWSNTIWSSNFNPANCVSEMISWSIGLSLREIIFVMTLYETLHRAIRRYSETSLAPVTFGIRRT